MARTANAKEEALPLVSETADVHHIIRTIAAQDLPQGAISPDKADAVIRSWLQQGYKLHTVTSLGTGNVSGVFTAQLLYIVVRD